nr:hypothetical protein [Tanacetum cinerariifolium]
MHLIKEELSEFLFMYPIPSKYKVILPKTNQTVYDASNVLNPFGCAKLTTFAVMCKAYGCGPTMELFRRFFNLFPGGQWLTFAKIPEKRIPNLLPKVITRIEGWKSRFFFVQDSIILVDYPELLFKDNWGFSGHQEKLVIHSGSVVARIKDRKYRTRGSLKTLVKHMLVQAGSSSRATHQKTSPSKADSPFLTISDDEGGLLDVLELQNANSCHLKIFNITPLAWRGCNTSKLGHSEIWVRGWVGRGVKEKRSNVSNIKVVKDGVVQSITGDFGNAAMEVELPSIVDENVVKENQIPLESTTGLGSYPPLPTRVNSAGNAPGKSSYANVTGKPSGKN